MISAEQLAAIEQRAEAATPGPWFDQYEYDGGRTLCQMRHATETFCVNKALHAPGQPPYFSPKENGMFIAAARSDVPVMVAEIRTLWARIAELEGGRSTDLSVEVTAPGELVIRIGIDTLAFALERMEETNPFNEDLNDFRQLYRIVDPVEFAKDVSSALCDEGYGDSGSTPLTRLLDASCLAAIESGSLGCEEVEATR
jgi:hypothetical protein